MIFTATHTRLVLAGKKTMRREPIKPDVVPDARCPYREGQSYALQPGHAKKAIARVLILMSRRGTLGDLTFEDARAEGLRTRDDYREQWELDHGEDTWDDDLAVWVIRFELAPLVEPLRYLCRPIPASAGARGSGRHKTAPRGDYTTSPQGAIDELPVVSEIYQAAISDTAQLRDLELRRNPAGEARRRRLAEDEEIRGYRGLEPDEVFAVARHLGTPAQIAQRRRRLHLRALDGLPEFTPEDRQIVLGELRDRGASVRDIARALDCSTRYAHTLQRQWRSQENEAA